MLLQNCPHEFGKVQSTERRSNHCRRPVHDLIHLRFKISGFQLAGARSRKVGMELGLNFGKNVGAKWRNKRIY